VKKGSQFNDSIILTKSVGVEARGCEQLAQSRRTQPRQAWDRTRDLLIACPTPCILYSLQSKVIRTGSALETTTFSSQSATVLVASLLLYVVFFDLNRFSSM